MTVLITESLLPPDFDGQVSKWFSSLLGIPVIQKPILQSSIEKKRQSQAEMCSGSESSHGGL